MSLTKSAILEIHELSSRAEALARGSAAERKQADILVQRIATIKLTGLSSTEARAEYASALNDSLKPGEPSEHEHRSKFSDYLRGKLDEKEFRDFLAGTQSITTTQGAIGGFLVPIFYDATLREAMAQVDPILDSDVTSFMMTPAATLQPSQVSGWDLSSITAELIGESVQQTAQPIPTVAGGVLKSNLVFKTSFAASWEAETDIPGFAENIIRGGAVALARKIGQSVMSGRGTTDILGLSRSLTPNPLLNNATGGKLVVTDLTKIFFAVNRFYRAAPKCGWLMSDATYQLARNATDNSGRPLLSIEGDSEMLMGKPVYVSPSLATIYSSIGLTGAIVFGDLSSIVIRASRPTLQRSIEQSQADITRGQALWIARQRADFVYFDPSAGANPPLVMAAIS
jgi:HK97 family phage major capsid protein